MAVLTAFLIWLLLSVVIWFVAVAIYNFLVRGPDLRQNPRFVVCTCTSIFYVTTAFSVFPWGYLVCLVVWWLLAKYALELSLGKTLLFLLICLTLRFLSLLIILGALEVF